MNWQKKTNRFVLFYDILGFKDIVSRRSHDDVLNKLESLNDALKNYSGEKLETALGKYNVQKDQVHIVIFSDSIIVFTKSDESVDAFTVLGVAHAIHTTALASGLAIKGAISYGEVSVDLERSIFFGQPIIDAYLLHDELELLSVILDHNSEHKINSYDDSKIPLKRNLVTGDTYLKCGKITHTITRPSPATLKDRIENVKKLYTGVSGKPRRYFDNTLKFYNDLLPKP